MIISILRDIFDNDFTGIHVDDPERNEIKDYLRTIAPDKVSIQYFITNQLPFSTILSRQMLLVEQCNAKRCLFMIEHTEALHTSTGNRSNKAKSQEQTALEVNLIAASEIARQLG